MARRFIDISVALEAGIASDPPIMLPQIDYLDHKMTAGQIAGFFPGLTVDDLPGGDGWAVEMLRISSHNGTHLDAPYHHHSTMDGGKRAITIDEVPLEWCMNPGVKLDFRHLPDGHLVSAAEVEAEL
ncbi:MAG: cyclase family protein, partial [Rhodobacterales bacterium]|nr:cyclase family protein [Rhodobacterales bacterium]